MEDILQEYWSKNYTVEEIKIVLARKHGISYSARHIQRLLKKMKLKRKGNESPIDDIVAAIKQELASGSGHGIGIRPMQYRLQKKHHLNVSRQTVNDVLKILTPASLQERQTGKLTRRVYSVRGPNHIWHCDGYDKLKPFGICIHGAIDGWSRRLIWLVAGRTNNDPNVICSYYIKSVRELGFIPRTLRLDAGTENVVMADVYQLLRQDQLNNFASKSVIIGKSVHNERIERFWSYLVMTYTRSCIDLFKDMRDSGVLDVSNAFHIECLRFCFIPVVQCDLNLVTETWNDHRIRKQTNNCVVGRPSFLYDCPLQPGSRDMSVGVDLETLTTCEDLLAVKIPVMGASDEFSELALEVMLMHDLKIPSTLYYMKLWICLTAFAESWSYSLFQCAWDWYTKACC